MNGPEPDTIIIADSSVMLEVPQHQHLAPGGWRWGDPYWRQLAEDTGTVFPKHWSSAEATPVENVRTYVRWIMQERGLQIRKLKIARRDFEQLIASEDFMRRFLLFLSPDLARAKTLVHPITPDMAGRVLELIVEVIA